MGQLPDNSKTAFRVGLIGCGQIASLWDEAAAKSTAAPKTHAKAFTKNSEFSLVACSDLNLQRAQDCAKVWNIPLATSHWEDLLNLNLDVLCLCTPVDVRTEILKEFLKLNTPVIFCEKPFLKNQTELFQIKSELEKSSSQILVNFIRRWAPEIQKIKKEFPSYGKLMAANVVYTKGILNNGSHMLDLLSYLFGDILQVQATGKTDDDRALSIDPTLKGFITTNSGSIFIDAIDHRSYTLFELDFCFENKRIRLTNRAFDIQKLTPVEDPVFPGYRVLDSSLPVQTGVEHSFTLAVQEIAHFLKAKKANQPSAPLSSTWQQAFGVLKATEAFIDSYNQGCKVIHLN